MRFCQVYGPVANNQYGSLSFPAIWASIYEATGNSNDALNATKWAAVQHEIFRVARVTARASLVLRGKLTWLSTARWSFKYLRKFVTAFSKSLGLLNILYQAKPWWRERSWYIFTLFSVRFLLNRSYGICMKSAVSMNSSGIDLLEATWSKFSKSTAFGYLCYDHVLSFQFFLWAAMLSNVISGGKNMGFYCWSLITISSGTLWRSIQKFEPLHCRGRKDSCLLNVDSAWTLMVLGTCTLFEATVFLCKNMNSFHDWSPSS